jgi:hypothetical protein
MKDPLFEKFEINMDEIDWTPKEMPERKPERGFRNFFFKTQYA